MSTQHILVAIKTAVQTLLSNNSDQIEVKKQIDSIHKHFQGLTEITGYDSKIEHLAAIPTARGKALGLNHAAQCLLDYKRTVKFLTAVVTAIKEKQKTQEGVIKIFYAGCGPYAPFVTLIAPLFSPKEIQFSVLEINSNSLKSAKQLIQKLHLNSYMQEYHLADAVTFKVPNPAEYHILISETLDALLYRECYVPILFNLLSQFNPNVTLIPENVKIHFSLSTGPIQNPTHQEKRIITIVDVREAVSKYADISELSQLPDQYIDVKSLNISQYTHAVLDTEVLVYNDICLTRNESSLSLSQQLDLEQPFNFKSIVFTYVLEPEIELKFGVE